MNNPASDTRTFLGGNLKKHEVQFYLGHQAIEVALENTIQGLQKIISGNVTPTDLAQAEQGTKTALGLMVSFYRDLDKDAFQAYKPFFDVDIQTGQKGPSGAFSGKIPYIDLLLYGARLPEEQLNYIAANKDYFPVADYRRLQDIINIFSGALDILPNNSSAQNIAEYMLKFRQGHRTVVKKHIGEDIINGSAEGPLAAQFLDNRIKVFQSLIQKGKHHV